MRDGPIGQLAHHRSIITITTTRSDSAERMAAIEECGQHVLGAAGIIMQLRTSPRTMVEETPSANVYCHAERRHTPPFDHRLQKWLGETPPDGETTSSPTLLYSIAIAVSITIHRELERLNHYVRLFTVTNGG